MDLRIEELSLSAWPALQTMVYDGWILRFAEGYTKRSNSVNPLYASTLDLDEKIRACEEAYAAKGLPPIFKILDSDRQKPIDDRLGEFGYERIDETSVRGLGLDRFAPAPPREGKTEVEDAFSEAWIDEFCRCSRNEEKKDIIARLLRNVIATRIVVRARLGAETVGCGYGALELGHVGIFDIVVKREMRARGFGEAIVRSILERGAALGARRAYLQVVVGNAPAERLYDKLGFREMYRYWYRKK
jgi:N-acetylglutamate synthase